MTAIFATQHHAIEARLKAQITLGGDGGAAVPTVFGNDPAEYPDDGLWVRLTIRQAARDQADIGATVVRSRTVGVAIIECFDDFKAGSKNILELADRVIAVFSRVTVGGIVFRTPYLQGGSSGDRQGKFARVTVACPFIADDLT